MRTLAGLVMAVGCVLMGGRWAQAQTECAAPVRIATWNIENFDLARAEDPNMLATIAEVWVALDADVVALQEIGHPDAMELLLDEVERLTGRYYVYALSEYSNRRQRVGFAWDEDAVELLSETEEIRDIALSGGGLRPGLTADFQFGDYDFTLFVVHLKAGREANDGVLRDAQSLLMARWLQERPASADPDVIFLGDFNDDYDSRSLAPIAQEVDFLTDELGFAASYIGGDFFSLIDHIAVTPGTGAADEFCSIAVFDLDTLDLDENLYEAWASDHLPVVATFTTAD